MTRKYDVTLRLTDTKLASLLTELSGEVELLGVVPAPEDATPPSASHYAGGKRNKGTSSEELLLEVLGRSDRPFTTSEIKDAFVAKGFAPTSFTPPLYRLISQNKIRNLGNGRYCLPGVVIKMGASAT